VLSFLITGLGQIYAGEAGKGVALLLGGTTATVVAVSSLYCSSAYGCDDDGDATAALFGIAALGFWIYSIADADDAVERWNTRNGLVARSTPILASRDRRTLLGVSLSF
jgi:TM2 domain-containing membrane protein YozV